LVFNSFINWHQTYLHMDNSVCINLNIVYKEYINNYIYNMYEPKLNVNNIYENYLNSIM